MQSYDDTNLGLEMAGRVRRNATSAGIAAACLLYFGFLGGSVAPDVMNLFTLGDAVFNYTLRIGGVLMALVAVGSLSGRLSVLLADAAVSVAIGLSLAFSGVAMIVGGGGMGLNYLLYVIFGGMFISAGVRNGREHSQWVSSPTVGTLRPKGDVPRAPVQIAEMERPAPPEGSLAGRLLQQRSSSEQARATLTTTSLEHVPTQAAPHSNVPTADESSGSLVEAADQPTNPPDSSTSDTVHKSPLTSESDGRFLSAFANDDPPPTP